MRDLQCQLAENVLFVWFNKIQVTVEKDALFNGIKTRVMYNLTRKVKCVTIPWADKIGMEVIV